jgi:hypothetical protein
VTRPRVFFVCTGAGAGIQQHVWSTPGCSGYFAGAAFPYSKGETDDFLGFAPQSYCSTETAIQLAMAAYMRAWSWPDKRAIGVAITASVASLTEHRGEHRIHAAAVSEDGCWAHTVTLTKETGAQARRSDGAVADALAQDLWWIAEERRRPPDATELARKLFFERPFFGLRGDRHAKPSSCEVFFPGAFNPPHATHLDAAKALDATFWIDASAPNKPPLPLYELCRRAKMLRGNNVLFTEDCPLYIDKARRQELHDFLIGTDALRRMLDPQWGPDVRPMLHEMSALGVRFLVLDRGTDKAFDLLIDAGIPVELQGLFRSVGRGGNESSTAIREALA